MYSPAKIYRVFFWWLGRAFNTFVVHIKIIFFFPFFTTLVQPKSFLLVDFSFSST